MLLISEPQAHWARGRAGGGGVRAHPGCGGRGSAARSAGGGLASDPARDDAVTNAINAA